MLIMEPGAVLIMSVEDDETCKEFLEPLWMEEKEFILIPINDIDSKMGKGSHWALLLYIKDLN